MHHILSWEIRPERLEPDTVFILAHLFPQRKSFQNFVSIIQFLYFWCNFAKSRQKSRNSALPLRYGEVGERLLHNRTCQNFRLKKKRFPEARLQLFEGLFEDAPKFRQKTGKERTYNKSMSKEKRGGFADGEQKSARGEFVRSEHDGRCGMEIREKAGERTLLLSFSGEMDHHGVRDTLRRMELAIDAALPKTLTLDFSGVTFMDSSGIALILRSQRKMQLWEGSVVLRNVPQQARRVLDAAGILRLVAVQA